VPSTPFKRCRPRSFTVMSEPTTRSRTVLEVTTSPGPAVAITRAAMCTAIPPTSPSRSSTSPVCRPARICRPIARSSSRKAAAQRIPRPGPSKVASTPSPVVLMSWPWNSSTTRRASSSCTSSSSRQRRSPSRLACSVDPTMSVNNTVASTRVGVEGRRGAPRNSSTWSCAMSASQGSGMSVPGSSTSFASAMCSAR
jgi:hypothetical protein